MSRIKIGIPNMEFLYDSHIGCYGEFNAADDICRSRCALNLRCAIDTEKNLRLELFEELMLPDEAYVNYQ